MELPEKYLVSDEDEVMPRAISKVGIASVSALVAVGLMWAGFVWYGNNHYNTAFQSAFMVDCENEAVSESRCGCNYGVMRSNFSYADAKAMIANPHGPKVQALDVDYIHRCGT